MHCGAEAPEKADAQGSGKAEISRSWMISNDF